MPGDRIGPLYWDDWSRPEYQMPWPDDDCRDDDDPDESTGWDEDDDDEDPTY